MVGIKQLQRSDEKEFYTELGRFMTIQRLKLGLSQKDIARDCGVTFQQVQKYEVAANRVPVFVLHKMAQEYGISFATIIGADMNECDYRVLDRARVETLIQNAMDALQELSKFLSERN